MPRPEDSGPPANFYDAREAAKCMPDENGIAVYLRLRPTTRPSPSYAVEPNGRSLRWAAPHDAAGAGKAFTFDRVLPMDVSQAQVFERVGRGAVRNALDGYNSTVFAYGQTGSGKTFTIRGGAGRYEDRGLIPRALGLVFQEFKRRSGCAWSAHLSYMEIYNEQGVDLFAGNCAGTRPRVKMLEDERGGFHLKHLSMRRAASEEEALNLLFLGDANRAVGETTMNQASSRSHCLLTVFLEAREAGGVVRRSKLHLVDLAGSERVHKTKSDGMTLNEAKYINTSLFYLEMVIVALNEKNKKARDHIPYRNSMMTSVLRDSLGGNCRTVMVATCSAEAPQTEESISTCRFAQRVARVKNDAVRNEETDPAVTIARLEGEVASLKARLGGTGDEPIDGRLVAALARVRALEAAFADVRATTSRFFGFEIEEEEMRARLAAALESVASAEPLATTGRAPAGSPDPSDRRSGRVRASPVGSPESTARDDPAKRPRERRGDGDGGDGGRRGREQRRGGNGERGAARGDGKNSGREVEARLVSGGCSDSGDRRGERIHEPPAGPLDAASERENRLRRQLEAARSRMRKHEQMRDWLLRRRDDDAAAARAEEAAACEARMREADQADREARRRAAQKRKIEEYYVSTRATEAATSRPSSSSPPASLTKPADATSAVMSSARAALPNLARPLSKDIRSF